VKVEITFYQHKLTANWILYNHIIRHSVHSCGLSLHMLQSHAAWSVWHATDQTIHLPMWGVTLSIFLLLERCIIIIKDRKPNRGNGRRQYAGQRPEDSRMRRTALKQNRTY